MNCPNCGQPETARVRVCPTCNQAYASQDLLLLRQLEFLIEETAAWKGAEALRAPYLERMDELRSRLVRREPDSEVTPPVKPEVLPEPVAAQVVEPEAVPIPAAVTAAPSVIATAPEPIPPPEPAEKVPFDQWLLSERNIKFALYGGALLLVIAGIIFVGVNWARIPGPAKFAITVMVTGLTMLGGYLLFQRPAMKLGGIAVLGVACGFLALNFVVLQIYVLGPNGLRDDVMWLIASPLCLLAYLLIAHWTRGDFFTYIGLGAVASTAAAALTVSGAPAVAYLLTAALLATALLPLAWRLRSTNLADFTYRPLLFVAQGAMPLLLCAALIFWAYWSGCRSCNGGSPWLAIATLAVGVPFYAGADWVHRKLAARWGATALFDLAFTVSLIEAGFSDTAAGMALMILALVQLLVGRRLESRVEGRSGALPLYVTAALLALLVTGMALSDQESLTRVLMGDVVLLAVAAWIFRFAGFEYGAVWLFMLPVYLLLDLTVPKLVYRGLLMGLLGAIYGGVGAALVLRKKRLGWPFLTAAAFLSVVTVGLTWESPAVASLVLLALVAIYLVVVEWLEWRWLLAPVYATVWTLMLSVFLLLNEMVSRSVYQGLLLGLLGLNYAAAGYALARRARRLAWPFLTAAAFLSAIIVFMIWEVPPVAGLVLAAVAVLYALVAVWLNWSWLLLPGLATVNLAVLAANLSFYQPRGATEGALVISYALLGMVLAGGGLALKRGQRESWSWPLYLVGAIDLALGLAGGLAAGDWLAVGLATVTAACLFAFAWWEREPFARLAISPLGGAAVGVVFVGFFFLLDALGGRQAMETWPAYTAGLCGLFVALGWLLRREPLGPLYGAPFRFAGLSLMAIPAIGAVTTLDWTLMAVTFAIAAITYAAEAAARQILNLAYLSLGILVLVIWMVLGALEVIEPQAYAAPLGVALLGAGWNQRRRKWTWTYVWPTVAGLLVLMGSAFVQSVEYRGASIRAGAAGGKPGGDRLGSSQPDALLLPGGRSGTAVQHAGPARAGLCGPIPLDPDRRYGSAPARGWPIGIT